MQPTESALHGSIFRTLRHLNVSVGDQVELPRLKRQWFRTGLREADLIDGLASLCAAGSLTYVDSDRGFITVKTALSQPPQKSDKHPLQNWYRKMKDSLLRSAAKIRHRPGPSLQERRQKPDDDGDG